MVIVTGLFSYFCMLHAKQKKKKRRGPHPPPQNTSRGEGLGGRGTDMCSIQMRGAYSSSKCQKCRHWNGLTAYIYNLNQWAKKGQKFNFPSSKVKKMTQKTPPHLVWGFSRFNVLFLSHLCLFLPYFFIFPAFLDFLKPKSGPSNEVIGIYI